MGKGRNIAGWAVAAIMLAAAGAMRAGSQTVVTNAAPTPAARAAEGTLIDQVIAVVNDDLILESDIDEERRFGAFQPLQAVATGFSRAKAIERLVDRALILQQAKLQPDLSVSDDEVKAQLQTLRKDIPACRQYRCETEQGWAKFVADQGFTVPELTERWRSRMEVLKFVEERFSAGIQITPAEIKTYYDKTLVPEYAKQKVAAPALDTISDRISEILLQERVTNLLEDWLGSLKAQGTVRMMKPAEVQQ